MKAWGQRDHCRKASTEAAKTFWFWYRLKIFFWLNFAARCWSFLSYLFSCPKVRVLFFQEPLCMKPRSNSPLPPLYMAIGSGCLLLQADEIINLIALLFKRVLLLPQECDLSSISVPHQCCEMNPAKLVEQYRVGLWNGKSEVQTSS